MAAIVSNGPPERDPEEIIRNLHDRLNDAENELGDTKNALAQAQQTLKLQQRALESKEAQDIYDRLRREADEEAKNAGEAS